PMVDKDDNDSKKPADDEELDEAASDRAGSAATDDDDTDADARANGHDADAPVQAKPATGTSAVERAASRVADAHDHGLAHIAPVKLLLGVFGALTVLTVFTVVVTAVDLGSQGNFVVAMIIATV